MDKKNIKINKVDSEAIEKKFIDKLYNNKFFLIFISVIDTVVLLITIAILIAAFTVWK